jgi:hypothetical protein
MHACAARTTVADRRADARARGPRPMRRHEMNAALVRVVRARVGGQRPPPLLCCPCPSPRSAAHGGGGGGGCRDAPRPPPRGRPPPPPPPPPAGGGGGGGGCRVAARPDGPGQSRPRTYGRGARLRGPGAKADCPPAACHRTSPCPCHLETRAARAMATPHAGPEQPRSQDSET